MTAIRDEVRIQAPAGKVYEALTRQAGYRGWWNAVAEIDESVGGHATLRFVKDGQPVHMGFRIDDLQEHDRVRWTCVSHDMPSWIGTSLTWTLKAAGNSVVVALEHGGWRDAAPESVAQGWKYFLGSLKQYAETGVGQPW